MKIAAIGHRLARDVHLEDLATAGFFGALCLTGYGNRFIVTFPLNITQMLMIAVCGILVLDRGRLRIPTLTLPMMVLMGAVTFGANFDLAVLSDRVKALFGVVVFCVGAYSVVRSCRNDLWGFVRIYYGIAVFAAAFAIVQVVVWLLTGYVLVEPVLKSNLGSFLNLRAEAFGIMPRAIGPMREPSALVSLLLPALYLSIQRMFGQSDLVPRIPMKFAIVVVCGYMLTFSLNGYLGLVAVVSATILQRYSRDLRRLALAILASGAILVGFAFGADSIRTRILQVVRFDLTNLDTSNLSTFAILSNGYVTAQALKASNLVGFGINSHPESYDAFIGKEFSAFQVVMRLNTEDAASMYFHLLSEFGVAGLLGFMFLVFRSRRRSSGLNEQISKMAFLSILVIAVRNGNYMDMMMWMCLALLVVTRELGEESARKASPDSSLASSEEDSGS